MIARTALAWGLLLAAAPLTAAAASPSQPTDGLAYVALGDSYAAGFGQAPTTGKPVKGCGQAATDYPHRIAKELGLRLTDVTCAGAQTANIVSTPQKVGTPPAPVQVRSLSRATRLVTITVGGNDLDFVHTMQSCLAVTPSGPILKTGKSNCKESFVTKGVDTLAARITDVVSVRLKNTFAAIRTAAPNAKVFVVGYPAIMPDAANTPAKTCFIAPFTGSISSFTVTNAFPYTNTDITYLHSIEVKLDGVTRDAALQAGFDFTSLLGGSEAHTPCSTTPWLNGITLDSKASSFTVGSGALHPNALGEAYTASILVPEIRAALTPTPTPTSGPTQHPQPSKEPSLVLWYLSLGLILAVLLGGAAMIIRRQRRK